MKITIQKRVILGVTIRIIWINGKFNDFDILSFAELKIWLKQAKKTFFRFIQFDRGGEWVLDPWNLKVKGIKAHCLYEKLGKMEAVIRKPKPKPTIAMLQEEIRVLQLN